ncbi:hypothetical protein ACFWBN_36750 [Streptomyces sp. NPDC059989]|uniref:hypothetical protein n=1 Tax=Streptomyces sp. NPDC059989 TaxID=3347026 RepID=UPI00368DB3C9
MSLSRIRRLALMIVKALESEAVPSGPSSVADASSARRSGACDAAADPDSIFDTRRVPWSGEMAAPSFMIVSTLPRR